MNKKTGNAILAIGVISILIISGFAVLFLGGYLEDSSEETTDDLFKYPPGTTVITKTHTFSEPVIKDIDKVSCVYVDETNVNSLGDGIPVIPVNVTVFELPFGSKIIDTTYEYSEPMILPLSNQLSYGSYNVETETRTDIYNFDALYPTHWMSYHMGGGLLGDERKTFLVLRANPVRYAPGNDTIHYIKYLNVTFAIEEPIVPLIEPKDVYDLLIISPDAFTKQLEPLVEHKESNGVPTKLITTEEIYEEIHNGKDDPENIKYYIKQAIEHWGIRYVLLVGGLKGQSTQWMLPARYSYVIPPIEQEYAESNFLTDLYFADIYDAQGNFSCWDSNNNEVFSEWNERKQDIMDLYPDVYLCRLACRNSIEVKQMVTKIINYEQERSTQEDWFQKIILIGGDSYPDENQYNEGENICNEAATLMPGFDPVKIYASEKLTARTINRALNKGAGFIYFCGHGGVTSWGTHNPPDAEGWSPVFFYKPFHMNFLRNRNKYPVAVIGGCLNGKFDISMMNAIKTGQITSIFQTHSWAWKLTMKRNGGAIATIANSGLGTHGRDDNDYNDIIDYNEVLNGWMELRFLELYGKENQDILGDNYGQTITEYLHRFHGNNDKMDTKMVQQWILFGDPSLKIGGY